MTTLLKLKRMFTAPFYRRYQRQTGKFLKFDSSQPSQFPLSVVIPLVEKDLPVFGYCVDGLRENLLHPIKDIHIVAPENSAIRAACEERGCLFVNELDILPGGPEALREFLPASRENRFGWLYQQFLKYSIGGVLNLDRYLVFDSDSVLINPFKYELDGKWILDFSDGYRSELDPLNASLLGSRKLSNFSFMCHAMVFDSKRVADLCRLIESRINLPWKEGILQTIDFRHDLFFSEYELYGNFLYLAPDAPVALAYWHNRALPRRMLKDFSKVAEELMPRYRTLSFHSYLR